MRIAIMAAITLLSMLLVSTMGLQNKSKKISDTELGLSKTSVFDSPAPDIDRVNVSDPGDDPSVPANFPDQPPVVPHGVGQFLPITQTENQCMDCHVVEEKVEGEPTPIPRSHYVDFRNTPRAVEDKMVGARYVCVSCHVAPGDNKPLVGNSYSK